MYIFLDNFIFKGNNLFHFLEASLKGRIILGKYQKTESVDHAMLKEMVIYDKISEDPFNYKYNKLNIIGSIT